MGLYQLNSFAHQRKLSRKQKSAYWMREDICNIRYMQWGWYLKYIKNSCNSISKKQTQFKNGQRHWTEIFVQMAYRHLKKCSTSLTIKEMQVKTTVSYHITPIKMAIIKKDKKQVLARIWQRGNPCLWDHTLVENSMESPQKIKNRTAI